MDEDMKRFEELIRQFADAEFELKGKARELMLKRGVPARVADMVIANGSVRNLSWLLNAVVGQIVGDFAPTEKTLERGAKIYKDLTIVIRDILAEHSGEQVAFFSAGDEEEKEEEDSDGNE